MRTRSVLQVATCGVAIALLAGCGNKASGDAGGQVGGGAQPSGPAPEIAGNYSIRGTNPGGGAAYTGSLLITKRDKVYQFSWKSGAQGYDGVGVVTDNTVGVAFANGNDGKGCSVVHYKIDPSGALAGRWGAWGENASGTENATRDGGAGGLDGSYTVTGSRLDGAAYKGSLTVAAQGAGFLFSWSTGDNSQGFGIRKGSYVSVGIGGEQCGFVAYEIKPDGTLEGQWSSFKSKSIGTEVATKTK